MDVDPEVADENIERDLRLGRDQQVIGVVFGVIEIKRIRDTEVQPQSVELGNRPDHVQSQAGRDDDVILCVHLGVIDVVVVLHPDGGADAETHRTQEQVVWDSRDIFLSGVVRILPSEGRTHRVLRITVQACKQRDRKQKQTKSYKTLLVKRRSTMTHRQVRQIELSRCGTSVRLRPNPVTHAYKRSSFPFKIALSLVLRPSLLRKNPRLRQAESQETFYVHLTNLPHWRAL